jgi:hypothetical protein
MNRYLIYDNENGVGAYALSEDDDAEQFAVDLMEELEDDPNSSGVNIFELIVDNPDDVEMLPNVRRVWNVEWEDQWPPP